VRKEPPSGTNNIYVIHQAKAVGTITAPVGGSIDMNGVELILDEDGDTSITADTDDQIDFKTGGTDRAIIDSSGNVGIGTSSPSAKIEVSGADDSNNLIVGFNNTNFAVYTDGTVGEIRLKAEDGSGSNFSKFMTFYTHPSGSVASERMRIDGSGNVLVNTTDTSVYNNSGSGQGGLNISNAATGSVYLQVARDSENALFVNRLVNDGNLIDLRQDGTQEGTISVSGTTVSYNGFTGTHWSRLSDNSKPSILKGTILESLDEMMDWYQVQFDITDNEGNTINKKESYALGDGESVGDVITYSYEGTDYQATIIQEGDVKHTKSKISDTVDAKNVYGVFVSWDNDDDTVNDMYVAQTGTYVIRIHKDETVSKGDLIQSKGDGTGKVQADDIIRASTVAKVLSTTKIETYSDGSYIVPCSLHC
jgi:hypothetical protein